MSSILRKDKEMPFPHVVVLKASAGSGKTHTLTGRFVQFVLSEEIRKNRLSNILAITFSNNAAREMKERILSLLKSVYLGDPKRVDELHEVISSDTGEMKERAGLLVGEILDNYSDFQVKTIDSFMAAIFKASAIDFGFNPDFDILLSKDLLMDYSFNIFLRNVREGSEEAAQIEDIVDSLGDYRNTDAAYLWDPSSALLEEIKKIYGKISGSGKRPKVENLSEDLRKIKQAITRTVEEIEDSIIASGLKRHGNSSFTTILGHVRERCFPDLIGKGFSNPPVTNPGKKGEEALASHGKILNAWSDLAGLINEFGILHTRARCTPYLLAYNAFVATIEMVKRQQGKVFIEDINRHLAEYLDGSIVPDIYFRIGDTVFHFLIDEFQDTAPIQWHDLFPLIENSLSQGGSLFVVGDTKQAIYGFRNADYTIMKDLETTNPFYSAEHIVEELGVNYRSCRKIIEFNEKVFKDLAAANPSYSEAGRRSGLTDYIQRPNEEMGSDGHAEVFLCERDEAEPEERGKIQTLIAGLLARGYRNSDIAVLTQKNEDAVRVTGWLNEIELPFISYSSLDVRRRKVTGEVVALLNFLDSPTDDFSFGTFILGEIFSRSLVKDHPAITVTTIRDFCFKAKDRPPLYKAFQEEFPGLWEGCFRGLFRSSGFFPVYDLVTEVLSVFSIFDTMPDEEATLVKFLEVVKDFEASGFNSLRDFLGTAADSDDGDSDWDMAVPKNTDAVKVMTIHKSKGLGFPVAIVLLYEVKNRGFEYIIEEDRDLISLLKINQAAANCSTDFMGLYERERMKELVNRLNTLYVGFTRPEKELYIIGVKAGKERFPFDLLPSEEYPANSGPLGDKEGEAKAAEADKWMSCPLLHRHRQVEFPDPSELSLTFKEKRRGEFIHRVLFFIDFADAGLDERLAEIIRKVRAEAGADYPEEDIKREVLAITGNSRTAEYFRARPGRILLKEQEFSDTTGRLYRMDRVVLDPDRVTVIDFKTGRPGDRLEGYERQMDTYKKIIKEIWPDREVVGIIAYPDYEHYEGQDER